MCCAYMQRSIDMRDFVFESYMQAGLHMYANSVLWRDWMRDMIQYMHRRAGNTLNCAKHKILDNPVVVLGFRQMQSCKMSRKMTLNCKYAHRDVWMH
jgi:hypothetical protein